MKATKQAKVDARATRRQRVPLDWSRLLGFDQAGPAAAADASRAPRVPLARVGVKVGAKPGLKPTTRA